MKEEIKQRDYYFDNIKAIMIFLVVLGHFIELGMYKSDIFRAIWCAIYLFHMPIFIFITGYFTKVNIDNTRKAIKNYLIPYIFFSAAFYIFNSLVLKEKFPIQFLVPQYGMWFLITIFWYKVIYNGIYKIRGLFTISIILSILIGLDSSFTNYVAFSRTVVFLPFFIAGTRFKKEYLIQNKKLLKPIFFILIMIILIVFGYGCIKFNIPMNLLRGSIPYEFLNMGIERAIVGRIMILFLGFIVSYMILNIIPNKKLPISYIGQNTIIIYILHLFLIIYCAKYDILDGTSYKTFIISIIATIFVVFITSLPILKKIYNYFLEKICKLIDI